MSLNNSTDSTSSCETNGKTILYDPGVFREMCINNPQSIYISSLYQELDYEIIDIYIEIICKNDIIKFVEEYGGFNIYAIRYLYERGYEKYFKYIDYYDMNNSDIKEYLSILSAIDIKNVFAIYFNLFIRCVVQGFKSAFYIANILGSDKIISQIILKPVGKIQYDIIVKYNMEILDAYHLLVHRVNYFYVVSDDSLDIIVKLDKIYGRELGANILIYCIC